MNNSTEQIIQQAIQAAKAGDRKQAKDLLAQALKQDPENVRIWYLLSQVLEDRKQAIYCLERAFVIQPDNAQIKDRLRLLMEDMGEAEKPIQPPPKKKTSTAKLSPIFLIPLLLCGGGCLTLCLIMVFSSSAEPTPTVITYLEGEIIPPIVVVPTNEGLTDMTIPTLFPIVTESSTATTIPSLTPVMTSLSVSSTYIVGGSPACIPSNAPVEVGLVTNVVDGDTIDVSINGQDYAVRYIGMDTPETKYPGEPVQYFGPEAAAKNKEMVEGKSVLLVKDVSETDQYERLLRYVFVDSLAGVFVNYELVRQGYATVVTYPPDVACADYFREAERTAKEGLLGLWAPIPIPSLTPIGRAPSIGGSVQITKIFYDGDVPNVESDEYAEITNSSNASVNLKGWKLNAGDPGQDYIFPDFVLQPGQSCRAYTNETHPDSCGGSFGSGQALWNNNGDCGNLYDATGALVSTKCYEREF